MSEVETAVEGHLSGMIMGNGKPIRCLPAGGYLTRQEDPVNDVFLVLDGMLDVEVDGAVVAEVRPGAVVGERAVLEGGSRTSTLRASAPVRVAGVRGSLLCRDHLARVARHHRGEEAG